MPKSQFRRPLRPSDRLHDLKLVESLDVHGRVERRVDPDGYPAKAKEALDCAGLKGARVASSSLPMTVGDLVLDIPTSFRTVPQDEATRLNTARQGALRDMRREFRRGTPDEAEEDFQELVRDYEAAAQLLLLRVKAPNNLKPHATFECHLRTSDSITITLADDVDVYPRMWAVVDVGCLPVRWDLPIDETPYIFTYHLVHAVPDVGPLRLPNVHPSAANALSLDSIVRYVLSCLDLAHEEDLPDPRLALDFLITAHEQGLPSTALTTATGDAVGACGSFATRLLDVMERCGAARPSGRQRPASRLIKTFYDAENYAAEYVRYLGFADAAPTGPGSDGGVDVTSLGAVAQVKMEAVPTGRPVIQAISGIAALEQRSALVFSLAGYTAHALEWADRAGVACFEFAIDGTMKPCNSAARALEHIL